MKKRNTITITDGAGLLGISRQALSRTLKRHGVQPGPDGRYDAVQVFTAARAGALADKDSALAGDVPADDLHRQRLESQIRLLDVQVRRAEHELDVATSKVVAVEDHLERVRTVYGFAVRSIDVWIKSVSTARADAGLKHELEELRRRVYTGLKQELDECQQSTTKI